MKGITRIHGIPKKQAAAIRLGDLDRITDYLKTNPSILNVRNMALILVGFFGAFRRSELANLKWKDISFVGDGMVIKVQRSKTDQAGQGADCVIPFCYGTRCPVQALLSWQRQCKYRDGPVFCRLTKAGTVIQKAIGARRVNRILRDIAKAAGLQNAEQVTAHSLRRGFATESARLGASMPAIQRHGRWRSTKTVVEYIEAGQQFEDSALHFLNALMQVASF